MLKTDTLLHMSSSMQGEPAEGCPLCPVGSSPVSGHSFSGSCSSFLQYAYGPLESWICQATLTSALLCLADSGRVTSEMFAPNVLFDAHTCHHTNPDILQTPFTILSTLIILTLCYTIVVSTNSKQQITNHILIKLDIPNLQTPPCTLSSGARYQILSHFLHVESRAMLACQCVF